MTQALGYLERYAFVVLRGAGGERQIDSHGMVAAAPGSCDHGQLRKIPEFLTIGVAKSDGSR